MAVAVLLVSFVFVGAGKSPRTIAAEKIVLLDSHGRARLTIATPAIVGAVVDTGPDDPVIWLTDDKGADRAMLTADGLYFANDKSRPTVTLSSGPKRGAPALRFYAADGKVSWSAP
ncbi:MAG: hypothetical protein ABSD63_16960 [Candidatus Korobacteraceae bacterium]